MAIYEVVGIGEHGKYFDKNSYRDAINYISRNNTIAYTGGENVASIKTAALEMEKLSASFHKDSGKRIRHSVLSYDKNEQVTPEMADLFAKEIIQHYAPEFQIVYAVHEDTEHVHTHFVMNQVSYQDGHRYAGKKKDYYAFINHIRHVTHLPVITTHSSSHLAESL